MSGAGQGRGNGGLVEIPGPPDGVETRPCVACPTCGLGLIRVCWTTDDGHEPRRSGETRIHLIYAWRCDWCRRYWRGHPDPDTLTPPALGGRD